MDTVKVEKIDDINKEDATEVESGLNGHTLDSNCGEPQSKIAKIDRVLQIIDLSLNPIYTSEDFANKLQKQWFSDLTDDFRDTCTSAQIFTEPFQLGLLPNLMANSNSCKLLVKEMVEKVHWSRKQMDLYEFYQSTDLSNMVECRFLANFLQMLRRSVRPWLEKVTNLKLDYVSASCSMYTCGDYLLVHDDLLKDRQVAFVYYLSPWSNNEEWLEEHGGCLEIFSSDEKCLPRYPVQRKISPKNNQFAFFKVGSKSFHQVGEVTTFDFPRLTINGWFHGASNEDLIAEALRPFSKLKFKPPIKATPETSITHLLNEVYLKPTTKRSIQKRIEDNSEICLYEFFRREIFEEALKQLLNDRALKWSRKGPANAQNFEVLDLKSSTNTIAQMTQLFSNSEMFSLLKDYTDLDLAGENAANPSFTVEIQRWFHGDYTVLGDGAICEDNILDLIYYLNASEGAAVITYLSPDTDSAHHGQKSSDVSDTDSLEGEGFDDEDESVLLTITPVDNALNIVYRCEDKFRLYATIAFMTVVIVIGVPMWWKTTEVYRVSLPSSDIIELNDEPLRIKIRIGLFNIKNERALLLINELKAEYKNSDIWNVEFVHKSNFANAANIKTPAALESLILKEVELIEGDFAFIEWPKLQEEVLIANERTALIRSNTSAKKLMQVLNIYILQTHRVRQILANDQRDLVKFEAPQAEYDVTVSVLNPRPDIMDAKWHVQMAVETYLQPFLDQVSHISNYTLTTQWKFQLPFEADLRQVRDSSPLSRHYALSEVSLPHIITAIEKNLGSVITDKTPINLVVYVTPCDISPVYIYNKQNRKAAGDNINAFISPKWGGVIIANPSMETCKEYNANPNDKVSFFVQTNDVMQIMLHQLQKLLDISVEVTTDGVKTVAVEQLTPRLWEYESYLRRSAVTHIRTSINTLQSLIKLLDNISYIVINDDVGKAINLAFELIIKAKEALANHELMLASALAQKAFIASEQAFFDSSLLAQLYFPDEQKYAIYIPLFLPIMVPVVTSFSMMLKLLKKQRECKYKTKLA